MNRQIVLISLCLLLSGSAWAEPSEVVLKTIAMESASEPMDGQIAVAGVILERSRRSGRSLEAECLKPKQFSAWNTDSKAVRWRRAWLERYYTPETRLRASQALKRAMLEQSKGRNPGYRHYHRYNINQYGVEVKPYWARGLSGNRIGNHVFYKGVK